MSAVAEEVLVFRLDDARRRAQCAAVAEALALIGTLGAHTLQDGPLGTQRGLFHLALPSDSLDAATLLVRRLGYTSVVERVVFLDAARTRRSRAARWKGRPYVLEPVYRIDRGERRDHAPDRREFVVPAAGGGVRRVVGYRGGDSATARRGLPVVDARLLVNLAFRGSPCPLLDPFAGAGGIVAEARAAKAVVYSADVDPFVRYGLQHLGARHVVADARRLPFASGCFGAIASEPPFDPDTTAAVCDALREIDRVLHGPGTVAVMVAAHQAAAIRDAAALLAWRNDLDEPVDRKGTAVHVLAWSKPATA